MTGTVIRQWGALVLGMSLTLGLGLFCGKRLGAQTSRPPQKRTLTPGEAFGGINKGAAQSLAHIQAATRVPYRLNIENFYYWDLDETETLTETEPAVATGKVYLGAQQVGVWHMSGLGTGFDILGQTQVLLADGTFTTGTGLSSNGGIRSQVNCFPVVGGTGKYAKLTGNCGFSYDNGNFYLLPNVK